MNVVLHCFGNNVGARVKVTNMADINATVNDNFDDIYCRRRHIHIHTYEGHSKNLLQSLPEQKCLAIQKAKQND